MTELKPADSKPRPKRKRRLLWLTLGGVILVIAAFIALLPTFVTWGLGHGTIRSAINNQINGNAEFNAIKASWISSQTIHGLKISDASGKEAANVDVYVHAGLWQIITQQPGPIEITIQGSVEGEVREDGSISFAHLIRKDSATSKSPQSGSPPKPFDLADLPPISLNIAGLRANIRNAKTNQNLTIENLAGAVTFVDTTRPITIDLKSTVNADGVAGSFSVTGHASNLFQSDGALALRGASMMLDAEVQTAPGSPGVGLPFLSTIDTFPAPMRLQTLKFNLASDDLTQRVIASIEANAQIEGHPPTTVVGQVALGNMLTTHGELSLRAGTANITVQATNLPFKSSDVQGMVHHFKTSAVSADLTKTIVVAIDSNAQVQGQESSTLTASLSIDELFAPNGDLQLSIDKITGTIQGATLPTAVLQPAMMNTPIVLARDLGPIVDVNASFSLPSAGQSRDISVVLVAALLRLEAQAAVDADQQSVQGNHLLLDAPQVYPDVLKYFAGVAIDRPADVALKLTSFTIPPLDPQTKTYPLRQIAAAGILNLLSSQSATITLPAAAPAPPAPATVPISLTASNIGLQFDSPALGEHLNVKGTALIDGASVVIAHRITNLFNTAGQLDSLNALPIGTLTLENLPAATVVKFAPDQKELINEIIGQALNATATTSTIESKLAANVVAKSPVVDLTMQAVRETDSLHLVKAEMILNVRPMLAAMLQRASANPIVLNKTAAATIVLEPMDLPAVPGGGPMRYTLPGGPIQAKLNVPQIFLSNVVATVTQPIELSKMVADVSLTPQASGMSMTLLGNASINAATANANSLLVSNVQYNIEYAPGTAAAAPPQLQADLALTQLSMARLEEMLGRPVREFSDWTGSREQDQLHVKFTSAGPDFTAVMKPTFANVQGEFTAGMKDGVVTLIGATDRLVLTRAALEKRLNPAPVTDAANANSTAPTNPRSSAERIRVLEDVPASLNIKKIQFPMTMLRDEAFDPTQVAIETNLTAGTVRIVNPATESGDVQTTLSDVKVALRSTNLIEGVSFSIQSAAEAASIPTSAAPPRSSTNTSTSKSEPTKPAKPGSLDVNGKLVRLVNDQSKLNLAGATIEMTATAKELPTAVADALANMQGLIVAAVGPVMNATFKVEDFSPSTGQLDARIDTTNGWLETVVLGREESFRMRNTAPLKAELTITPPLRERLLYKINPILADIRTTEQPLRVSATGIVPADGDMNKLSADMEITIGKVQFDSGSAIMTLLKLTGQDKRGESIPGEIQPIVARIRKGILTYQKFEVHIDKWVMVYSGQVDLVKQTMNLRTEIPLAALAHSFKELEAYADKIVVPIVIRGKFGEAKAMLDPDFDIGRQALDAGFTGAIDQLLKGKGKGTSGNPLEDLLDRVKPK